jgi:hypothetical protein
MTEPNTPYKGQLMKYFLLFLLISSTSACISAPDPDRLPATISVINDPVQWEEYCKRKEFKDPSCEKYYEE